MRRFKALKKILKKELGERFLTDAELLTPYETDESGEKGSPALGAAFPENQNEVSRIASLCYRYRVPYTVRGLGTGKTGGMLLTAPGLMVCLERMNRIEIDPVNLLAIVEPGAVTAEIQRRAKEKGLFYPVDPASLDMCSIGGNIAENAGGPRAFKYGVTRDFVLGLEAVLPDGRPMTLGGKTRKNVTGYALKDLIIGSEGTLATLTLAYLKLLPHPAHRFLIWAAFENIEQAIDGMTAVYASGITPSAIEFIESRAFERVARMTGQEIPGLEKEAHLLIELDGFSSEELEAQAALLCSRLEKQKNAQIWVIPHENKQEQIWDLRRKISEATKEFSFNKKSEDVVVPASNLKDFLRDLKHLESLYGVEILCFGHLGDGNVHVNILNVQDEAGLVWEKFNNQVIEKVFALARQNGGTLSGEHGIGLTKKPYLKDFIDRPSLKLHEKIKKLFDPKNLLNPGKIW